MHDCCMLNGILGKRSEGGDKGLPSPWFVLVSAPAPGGCSQPCCHPDTSPVIWVNDASSTCSLFTLFPCGQHNSFLCSFSFFAFLFSLSVFSYCLAPFAQTLRSPFASAQYLYCNDMHPCPFLPVSSTFFGLTSCPFASA